MVTFLIGEVGSKLSLEKESVQPLIRDQVEEAPAIIKENPAHSAVMTLTDLKPEETGLKPVQHLIGPKTG